jgi:hypothetical protein
LPSLLKEPAMARQAQGERLTVSGEKLTPLADLPFLPRKRRAMETFRFKATAYTVLVYVIDLPPSRTLWFPLRMRLSMN